ncbi:MAG: hypothetical protein IJP03_05960 [Christensenellaceae bacterium]|nr:hypothetical protein [Christensenellaceae bacterium]
MKKKCKNRCVTHLLRRTLAFVLVLALMLSLSGCMFAWRPMGGGSGSSYLPSGSGELGDLYADTEYLLVGTGNTVTFTISLSGSRTEVMGPYGSLGVLHDDGLDGDELAGDGIHSLRVTVYPGSEGTEEYWAESYTQTSYSLVMRVVDAPNEQEMQDIQNADAYFEGLLADAGPSISSAQAEDILIEMEEYAQDLVEEGTADSFTVGEGTHVSVKFASGIRVIYAPPVEERDAGSGDPGSIITCQPYYSSYMVHRDKMSYPDYAAGAIEKEFDRFTFAGNYDDEQVDLDRIRAFSSGQIILWHDHGVHDEKLHSQIRTGEQFRPDSGGSDLSYINDFVSDKLVKGSDGYIWVTAKWIEENCGDMSGSLIYVGTCQSGKDDVLANTFLDKGAAAVIVNDDTIATWYNLSMMYTTMTEMTKKSSIFGDYNTLEQALKNAKSVHGKKCESWGATVVIKGGKAAKELRLSDMDLPQSSGPAVKPAPDPTPTPAPTPTPVPQVPSQQPEPVSKAVVYEYYTEVLLSYRWRDYVPSDLSEIPYGKESEYWMGNYYLWDMDKDGTEELIIKCGQSMADMSVSVFTCNGSGVQYLGGVFVGDASIMGSSTNYGIVAEEHHGGLGNDHYIEIVNGMTTIVKTDDYDYEQPGYMDPKEGVWEYLPLYSVHDVSPLSIAGA